MKKVIIRRTGGPEVLELVEAPDPVAGPGEVVVRAEAMGVGWPDIHIRNGTYNWMPPLPASPGSELAGRIATLGPGVTERTVGEAVLVSARELPARGGCYAEAIAVPADSVFVLPDSADLAAAAGLGNFQVAWALLHEAARAASGETVLIRGAAGGVGSAAVQLARHAGMTVIGTVSTHDKAEFALGQGADHVIDYRREDTVARVREITGGQGADLILDHVGGAGFAANLDLLAPWGTLVSYGTLAGPPAGDVVAAMRARSSRCPALRCFSMHAYDADRARRRRVMERVVALFAEGAICPAIFARLPLARAAEAQTLVETGQALGRVVLTG